MGIANRYDVEEDQSNAKTLTPDKTEEPRRKFGSSIVDEDSDVGYELRCFLADNRDALVGS